jgi:CHAT domain-containing protein
MMDHTILRLRDFAVKYCRRRSHDILTRILFACLVVLCVSGVACLLNCRSGRTPRNVRAIGIGTLIDKELASGEADAFQVLVEAGQYLHIVVQQQGIEGKVALLGPGDQMVAEMESPYGAYALESVSAIADVKANYGIEVRSATDDGATGRYKLTIEGLRTSEPDDITQVHGERAFMQARKLASETGMESWRRAIEKYKEALSDWREISNRQEQATTLYCMGALYLRLDAMQDGASALEQALVLQRQVGYRRGEAYTLNEMGLVQAHLGNQRRAMEYLLQALQIWDAENDRVHAATTLNILGGTHDNIGEPQKALEYYNKALETRKALKDLTGQASTLNNIGVIYDEYGESQKTLEYYKQALQALELIKEPKLEDRRKRATAINNIGYTYDELGDEEKALEYYNQALPLRQETNDRRGEAYTLINIGYVHAALGDAQKALDFYNKALAIRKEVKDTWGEVYTLNYIGQAYASLGKPERALDYYNRALELLSVVQDRQAQASLLDKVGQAYTSLNQPQKAIGPFNQALALWRAMSDRRGEATTLLGIARVERDQGRLSRARNQVEAALKIVESLLTRISSPEARVLYFASVQQYYGFYIDLLMTLHKEKPSMGFGAQALQASERARARSLLQILAEAHADISSGVDQNLLERLNALRRQLNAKSDFQMRLLLTKASDDAKVATEKDVRALLNEYQQVQSEVRTNSPHYAALTQPQSLGLKQIQQQVLGPDTLILEYSLGDERSYLWSVSPTSLKTFELPRRKELEDQAARVYKLLTARQPIDGELPEGRQSRISQADAEYWPEATKLSQMLLGPVASILGKRRLLVVSEGALQYVPFSALPAPVSHKTQSKAPKHNASPSQETLASFTPLVLDHEIATLPSASVLALMRHELADRQPAPKAVAVLADPVFSKDDERVKSSGRRQPVSSKSLPEADLTRAFRDFGMTRGGLNLPRLLSLRREADAISEIAPAQQCLKALDFDANLEKATSAELKQYRIIHFATHGLLNNENPELSAIVLSLVDEQGQPQSGLLQLQNIYNLDLPAELVVLSACDTGLGKQIKGEGLVGLTRGFMYAGAARVVASLWKVDSLETEKLMKSFYNGMLVDGLRPLKALQKAQIEMWERSPQETPYYWAAFVLQGEWK